MSDLWNQGHAQFARRNYFAARDLWHAYLQEVEHQPMEQAQALNAIGATVNVLAGAKQALPYFEQAYSLCQRTNSHNRMRIKYIANVALTLCRVDRAETALKIVRDLPLMVSADFPVESATALNVYLFVLGRNELHREVVENAPAVERFFQALEIVNPSVAVPVAKSLYMIGLSLDELGDRDAWSYFLKAQTLCELPEVLQELCRLYLFDKQFSESVKLVNRLYDETWGTNLQTVKLELADTLQLVGAHAYFAGQRALFERCTEKAELYYGQRSRWDRWLHMRELENRLAGHDVGLPPDVMDWDKWSFYLDDLNLMDGIESMFPRMFRMSELAADLAGRLAGRLCELPSEGQRLLNLAGRLSYLGLTVVTSNHEDALRTLHSRDSKQQVADLGRRLLEAYPNSEAYRNMIHCARSGQCSPLSPDLLVMSKSLGVALDFVELIEYEEISHEEAVQRILSESTDLYGADILEAFRKETVLDS